MLKLKGGSQYYDEYINSADHDAVCLLKQYLLSNFKIQHVRSHQYKIKPESKLTTVERCNKKANELVENTLGRPISSHIHTSFVIYVNRIYHSNKYRNKIRSTSGEREAREFLMTKHKCTSRVIDLIAWDLVTVFISSLTYATRKTMTKFSRRWLMSNSKTIDNQMICPYYQTPETFFYHDHSLTCS